MLTRSRMCGLAAAIGAVLCLSAMRAGFAQEILKELESAERSQSQGHSGHGDQAVTGARLLAEEAGRDQAETTRSSSARRSGTEEKTVRGRA